MNNKIVLIIAALLILLGLVKPNTGWLPSPSQPVAVDVLELNEPKDADLKEAAEVVLSTLKKSSVSDQSDIKKLRNLYLDLARLVELDEENETVKTTEDIKQANALSGPMLRLDMKGKYPTLASETNSVMVVAIGDDNLLLSSELRERAVNGFNALAWACNESTK